MGDEEKTETTESEGKAAPDAPNIMNEEVDDSDLGTQESAQEDVELFEDDPFMEDWDDEEMMTRQAEWQRLLDDAAIASTEDLQRLGDMDPDQQAYIEAMSAGENLLPALQDHIEDQ